MPRGGKGPAAGALESPEPADTTRDVPSHCICSLVNDDNGDFVKDLLKTIGKC